MMSRRYKPGSLLIARGEWAEFFIDSGQDRIRKDYYVNPCSTMFLIDYDENSYLMHVLIDGKMRIVFQNDVKEF